jgi:hypothetical protein
VGIFASQLQHSGLIQARAVSSSGGKVVLQADKEVEVAGRIEAVRLDRGGWVQLSGDKLVLRISTVIDVRHDKGGGEIYIGGGKQGKDGDFKNGKDVDVEEGVQLKADATLSGPGGAVVVWADDKLKFKGELSARSAGKGYKGGEAEVASAREMDIKGKVDVRSEDADDKPKRKAGKKFDPTHTVAILPMLNQPEEVQAALSEPVNDSAAYLIRNAKLEPQSSQPAKSGERKVVITALQCSVTQ